MKIGSRVLARGAGISGVAFMGMALAVCGSTNGGGRRDGGGGGTAGSVLASGGSGAGGSGAGGSGAGGSGVQDAGACPPGQTWCPGCAPGSGSCARTCVGVVCPESDASPSDVPLPQDTGAGGMGSGGLTTAAGGAGTSGAGSGGSAGFGGSLPTSTGGSGAGGVGTGGAGMGGVSGSGGNGGSIDAATAGCARVPGEDAVCLGQSYPPLAYFCPAPAAPPSTACLMYNGIGSGDYFCCPEASTACPDSPPTASSPCSGTQSCAYGSHPDPTCRTRAMCSNETWQVSAPRATCNDPLPAAGCLATPTDATDCSPEGLECYYATGDYCICAQCTREYPACIFTDPVVWHCLVPPGGGCPSYYPNLGSACALPANTQCRYRCDLIANCSAQGVWVDGGEKCPICNSPDTPIATPGGNRPIASLVPGDLVYSIDHGQVRIVPIAEVGRQAQHNHHVMRLVLATGTILEISPRHPTADGRTMGVLTANDLLDRVRIVSAELVPYHHSHTYDILPASDTGTYYAGGVLIGSTLAPPQRLAATPTPVCMNQAAAK